MQGKPPVVIKQASNLMHELGLQSALVAHKAFKLALIQSGKIVNENMFKVLHEFKTSSLDFDNECIYCKYSQYAVRESAKIQVSEELLLSGKPDPRIDHLIKMF
jgi:hypothetical protein